MAGKAGPKQLRRLLDAVIAVGSALDLVTVLERITKAATELVGARYGALGVLDESGERLTQFVTVGIEDDQRAAIGDLPSGRGILGELIVHPVALRLPDLREHPASTGFPPNHPVMTSFLGMPIRVRDQVFGNLYLCDKKNGDAFTDIDEEMVVALATAAGVAIDNARLHARIADVVLLEDHERIARELHDTVVQRLFSTGLSLQGAMHMAKDNPDLLARLQRTVTDLDETVREVRSAIFELHTARLPGRSVRHEILELCAESARVLAFEPVLHLDGPIDASIDDPLADDIVAVTREALSNVARHAGASAVAVNLRASETGIELTIVDNGCGIEAPGIGGRGLQNMRARASKHDGELTLTTLDSGGTRLRWFAPLGPS